MLSAAALMLVALFGAPAFALDAGDITVGAISGDVRVTMKGEVRKVRAASVLELPATVRTGRDGAIELRQGATRISVGPDTLLDFPALEKPGAPVDRVTQPRGHAFYDIGKREGRKLRVETPYLVGVVKGTQFNVAVQEDLTTISLFEGLLEIRSTEDDTMVELEAGRIASRRRGDKHISVLGMDAGKAPTSGARSNAPSGGDGEAQLAAPIAFLPHTAAQPDVLSIDATARPDPAGTSTVELRTPAAPLAVDTFVDAGAGAVVAPTASNPGPGDALDLGGSAGVIPESVAEVNANAAVNAGGAVDADAGVSASLGNHGANVGVSVSAGADAGLAGIGASTSVSVDLAPTNAAIDTSVGAHVDAGAASVEVGSSAGVDLGTAGVAVDAGLGATVDAGPTAVDTSASIDVGPDSIGAAVDAGAALGNVAPPIDAGLTTAVDVSTGTVDLGVSVGGIDVGVGLDLGLGDNDNATDTGSSTTDTATDTGDTGNVDVGGLLDGLLRRPGRR